MFINKLSNANNLPIIGVITFWIWAILGEIDEIGPSVLSIIVFNASNVRVKPLITLTGSPTPGGIEVGSGRIFNAVITEFKGIIVFSKVSDNVSKVSIGFTKVFKAPDILFLTPIVVFKLSSTIAIISLISCFCVSGID